MLNLKFYLLFFIISFSNIFASDIQLSLLKKSHPKMYSKLINAQIKYNKIKPKDTVMMLISNSVPKSSIKNFIVDASILNYYFNTHVSIVLQGITNRDFEDKIQDIKKELSKYEFSKLFIKNINRYYDPFIFKKLNIKKVPILLLGNCNNGNCYPSDVDIRFMLSGDKSINYFFKIISKKDENYENYYNKLIDN